MDRDPGVLEDLDRLVAPVTRCDPESPLRWTCKGVRRLADELYDLGRNVGWVSVGVDHDTAAFAVESIRRWWRWMGQPSYPKAKRLLINADSGGSNGAPRRRRAWLSKAIWTRTRIRRESRSPINKWQNSDSKETPFVAIGTTLFYPEFDTYFLTVF